MGAYSVSRGPCLIANVITCVGLLGFSGCLGLNREGKLPPGANWDVAPPLFCPGDPVTVSWDFSGLPRTPADCRPQPGGYSVGRPIACASRADCPATPDGVCVDNACCTSELRAMSPARCPTSEGCLPAFNITVSATPPLPIDPVIDSESDHARGERTVTPSATTTFTFDADVAPVTLSRQEKTATMIVIRPETPATLPFPFVCAGGTTPGFASVNLTDNPIATEHAIIISVRNTSSHIIRLTGGDPTRGPERLTPGATTDVFNGPVRGLWAAALDPTDPAALIRPLCTPTGFSSPWPDLQVQLVLGCSAPPP